MHATRCIVSMLAGATTIAAAVGAALPRGPTQSMGGRHQGIYRASFEQGLAALEEGRDEAAARHFRAAGEIAPEALVWKAYLARAQGGEPPEVPDLTPDARGSWRPVPSLRTEPRFDPTGERLLSGHDPATLWDARTGERIAVLTHRSTDGGWLWRFDATGRLVVGLGRGTGAQVVADGIDVRDARTGDPIEVRGAATVALRWNSIFEWAPAGSRVELEDRKHTFQLALPDGVLRCSTPSTRDNEDYVPRDDGRRAVYLYRGVPSSLWLMDPRDGSTIASLSDGGWRAFFSESGRFVASLDQERVLLLDAGSGERLADAPVPADREFAGWACIFDGDLLLVADASGRVTWWDPASAREVRRLELEPPPPSRVHGVALAAGGERLIVNGYDSLQGYDTDSGRMVWSDAGGRLDLEGALEPDGLRLASGGRDGRARMVDVRSGETLSPLFAEPLQLLDVEVLQGADACIVSVSDGSLRRVDLATGRTTASVREPAIPWRPTLRSLDAERLLTWAVGRQVSLRDPVTLAPTVTIPLEPGEELLAIAEDGSRFATLRADGGTWVRALVTGSDALLLETSQEHPRDAVFSADGSRLALIGKTRARILDATTGERVADVALPDADYPGPVAFYGPDRLAVGWGSEEKVGVDVLGLPDGERIAHLVAPMCWLGGYVADLRCHPDVGRLVFSVSSCGAVLAFREEGWKEAWTIDYGGGTPAPLELQRPAGSGRLHVSGMMDAYARVVDLVSGEVLAAEAVAGCFDLDGTSSDRFVVGSGADLVVFSGETFERLYVRSEGSDGSAWLLRDGKDLEVVGGPGWDTRSRHLRRAGTSRPADCWDAWLLDPLALCPVSLDVLPEPPRIVAGPPRVLRAEGNTVELEVELAADEPLQGIQVEITGRAPRLEPVVVEPDGASSKATLSIDGPWPVEVRLRAVARSGVLSAPWRLDVQ